MKWSTLQSGYGIVHRSVMKSSLSRGAKLVYSLLCSYANSETSKAFPSQETMAKDLSCTDTSIQGWLTELKEFGCIEVSLEGMPAHNVYTVLYPTSSQLPSTVGIKQPSVVGTKKTNEKEERVTAPLKGGDPIPEAGDASRSSVMSEKEFEEIVKNIPWPRKEEEKKK